MSLQLLIRFKSHSHGGQYTLVFLYIPPVMCRALQGVEREREWSNMQFVCREKRGSRWQRWGNKPATVSFSGRHVQLLAAGGESRGQTTTSTQGSGCGENLWPVLTVDLVNQWPFTA